MWLLSSRGKRFNEDWKRLPHSENQRDPLRALGGQSQAGGVIGSAGQSGGVRMTQTDFSSDEAKNAGNTGLYFRGFLQSMTEKMQVRRAPPFCSVLP